MFTRQLQEDFLQNLIEVIFKEQSFQQDSTNFVKIHCQRGIRADQYNLCGEALFWSLEKCLGSIYNTITHVSWVKLYSQFLKVVIPVCVQHELENSKSMFLNLRHYFLFGKHPGSSTFVFQLEEPVTDVCDEIILTKNPTTNWFNKSTSSSPNRILPGMSSNLTSAVTSPTAGRF